MISKVILFLAVFLLAINVKAQSFKFLNSLMGVSFDKFQSVKLPTTLTLNSKESGPDEIMTYNFDGERNVTGLSISIQQDKIVQLTYYFRNEKDVLSFRKEIEKNTTGNTIKSQSGNVYPFNDRFLMLKESNDRGINKVYFFSISDFQDFDFVNRQVVINKTNEETHFSFYLAKNVQQVQDHIEKKYGNIYVKNKSFTESGDILLIFYFPQNMDPDNKDELLSLYFKRLDDTEICVSQIIKVKNIDSEFYFNQLKESFSKTKLNVWKSNYTIGNNYLEVKTSIKEDDYMEFRYDLRKID